MLFTKDIFGCPNDKTNLPPKEDETKKAQTEKQKAYYRYVFYMLFKKFHSCTLRDKDYSGAGSRFIKDIPHPLINNDLRATAVNQLNKSTLIFLGNK